MFGLRDEAGKKIPVLKFEEGGVVVASLSLPDLKNRPRVMRRMIDNLLRTGIGVKVNGKDQNRRKKDRRQG